ncbi:FAD-dependent monooxygenase [Streptomyces sp. NBC_01476]|uniref:FAD-dependent monooxygenase n=1 Tax=Streptomyces sp. NBC_01476 TaxID=2903881 RepID=UPI002E309764|nr:FAD-dependent monooxygenase [Streptomyces sp. NBC_01476]
MAAGEAGRAGPVEETQVVVVGAGPVGLLLAGELRLHGASVVVLERRESPTTASRATTLHARTMEIFDSRGLLADLGTPANDPRGHFGGVPMDLTLPTRYPGQWKVPQLRTEELLQKWAVSLGADVRRGWEVRAVADRGGQVDVTAEAPGGPRRLRAAYVVGCDGEQSTVRGLIGAAFPGLPARRELLRADVAGIQVPDRRFQRLPNGLAIASRGPSGVTRVMVHEFGRPAGARTGAPEFAEVVEVWRRVTGEDIGGGEPLWLNAFDDANRQLERYVHGRVLFAGDAAHVQMPSGGQALNLGLHDAFNLGWKLASAVRGPRSAPELLETYHEERHAVGARVLANIRAQGLLLLGGPEVEPVRALLGELIAAGPARGHLAGMVTGLDVRYPAGPGDHPLLGARLPHLELATAGGTVTTTELLRHGGGLLLDLSAPPDTQLRWLGALWADRVTTVPVRPEPAGPLGTGGALLVRPDGHVAWAGTDRDGATAALRRWFGPPEPGL